MKPIPSTFLRERFAKAVKEHRGKRTYRQVEKDLASLGGISPQTVARVES
jgi:transcriptional regulator with XRE-family HTH domain